MDRSNSQRIQTHSSERIKSKSPSERTKKVTERSKAILDTSVTTAVEQSARIGHVAKKGTQTAARQAYHVSSHLMSNTLSEINRYTPDLWDVGQYGERDLSADGTRFVAGHASMLTQNAIRANYWIAKNGVDALNHLQYGEERLNRAHEFSENAASHLENSRTQYLDVVLGKSYRDVTEPSDRYAWNRLLPNQFANLSVKEKGEVVRTIFDSHRYSRMENRSESLNRLRDHFESKQFSITKSTRNTVRNQSRKLLNTITRGNDPDSTASQAMYVSQKMIRAATGTTRFMYRRREMIKHFLNNVRHPVRFTRVIIARLANMLDSMMRFVTSMPAIISSLVALLPVAAIVSIVGILIALFANVAAVQQQQQAPAIMASPDYAANAFIYEAKKRNWTDNAIIGTLAYQLAEGGGMGTFTYENYYVLEGPSGVLNDTLQDNDAWLDWLNDPATLAKQNRLYYAANTTNYAAIGLGLLQDSDVWLSPTQKTVANATRLIHYAQDKGKSWQDPETQMEYNFDVRFSSPTAFDTAGVDPTKDHRSAEEWCRRVTAGVGMPAWSYTTNNIYMTSHLNQIPAARNYLDNYKAFDYADLNCFGLTLPPNFNNDAAWGSGNPYTNGCQGQCTWFAWGRFYEIYGFDGGFTGNGRDCVNQCLARHPDKFKFSTTPVAGSLFSWTAAGENHVGMVVAVQGDSITIMDGNVDGGVSDSLYGANHPWDVATSNWRTITFNSAYMQSKGAIYANPIQK